MFFSYLYISSTSDGTIPLYYSPNTGDTNDHGTYLSSALSLFSLVELSPGHCDVLWELSNHIDTKFLSLESRLNTQFAELSQPLEFHIDVASTEHKQSVSKKKAGYLPDRRQFSTCDKILYHNRPDVSKVVDRYGRHDSPFECFNDNDDSLSFDPEDMDTYKSSIVYNPNDSN